MHGLRVIKKVRSGKRCDMKNDYQLALEDDWKEFVSEVKGLMDQNPNITVEQVMYETGGDFEDVLWAMKTDR